jgi:hypothetical protein
VTERTDRAEWHGQHTRRFYVIGAIVLSGGGAIAGALIGPATGWPVPRSMLAGVLMGLWCGFCVYAWHTLVGTIEEE